MTSAVIDPVRLDRVLSFGNYSYPFYLRSGAWDELAGLLAAFDADRFALVTDAGVPDQAVRATTACLSQVAPVVPLPIPPGETAKNLAGVDDLATAAIAGGLTRRSVVIALGGGLTGNMAGLLAALLFRGIRLVHLPTTALAMWDSTPSLKQAVNSASGKNMIGTFYAPDLVWGNLDFLVSLPAGQIRSALCEAIKFAVAVCPDQLPELGARLRHDASYERDDLLWFADLCLNAKQRVMAGDPFEKNAALICEYGHTIGHAAEFASHGELGHGLAIGVGGLVAARAARMLGLLDPAVEQIHEELLRQAGAPTSFPPELTTEALIDIALGDNKRGYRPHRPGTVDMVLLQGLGQVHMPDGFPITQVPHDVLRAATASRTSQKEQHMTTTPIGAAPRIPPQERYGVIINDISGLGEVGNLVGGTGSARWIQLVNGMHTPAGIGCVEYVSLPPGASCGRHLHATREEIYFILSGDAVMTINDTELAVTAGDLLAFPLGTIHGIGVPADAEEEMTFLVIEAFPGSGPPLGPPARIAMIWQLRDSEGYRCAGERRDDIRVASVDLAHYLTGPLRRFALAEIEPDAQLGPYELPARTSEILFIANGTAEITTGDKAAKGDTGMCVATGMGRPTVVRNLSPRRPLWVITAEAAI